MFIVYFGLSWLAGLWLASILDWSAPAWLATAVAAAGLAAVAWRLPTASRALACVAVAALGGARYLAVQPAIDAGHVAFFNERRDVELVGRVVAEPDVRERSILLQVRVTQITLPDGATQPVDGLVQVQTFRFPIIPYGAVVALNGRLQTPANFDPDFDYRRFLARRNIHSQMRLPDIVVLAERQGNPIRHAILDIKERARQAGARLIPEPSAALLSAILLGDSSGLPANLVTAFRRTGMAHLTVVSGFHVAILVAVLAGLSQGVVGQRGGVIVTLLGLAIYVVLVGAGPSVLRAALMGSIYLIGTRLLGRPNYTLGSFFVAAVVLTAVNPHALWEVGFQLSFAATLGLILYAGCFDRWLHDRLERWLPAGLAAGVVSLFVRALVASLAAQLLTVPLVMYYFEQVSLVSLLANVLLLPFQPFALVLGGLATLLGLVWLPLAQLVAWVAWLFLNYTVSLVRLLDQVPLAAVPATLSSTQLWLCYAGIAGASWLASRGPEERANLAGRWLTGHVQPAVTAVAFVAALLSIGFARSQPDGLLHVVFFDVGQGDAIFIQTPSGRQILVDGGFYPAILNDRLGRQMPFWDRHIDIVVATHPDADHISGLPGVFERYRVDWLLTDGSTTATPIYDAVLAAAEAAGTPARPAVAGEVIVIEDGVRLEILHPGEERSRDNRNDNSVSLRLVYGDFTLLLTGDAEEWAEQQMLRSGRELDALVFKAGHHGSRTSSTAEFLAAVRPQIVVVSAGQGNRFEHPHPEVLARAAAAGAAVLRTDELGTIRLATDGRHMWWQTGGR